MGVPGEHRTYIHRIDKYPPDTRRPIATAADRVATDHSRRRSRMMADCPSYYQPIPACPITKSAPNQTLRLFSCGLPAGITIPVASGLLRVVPL